MRGQAARLNGKIIRVSQRRKLREAIVSIGFTKTRESLEATLPYFNNLVHRVRKIRMMGSAALGLTYVASGRFDAYIERGIRLWDIAAGGLIIECAGGEFWHKGFRAATPTASPPATVCFAVASAYRSDPPRQDNLPSHCGYGTWSRGAQHPTLQLFQSPGAVAQLVLQLFAQLSECLFIPARHKERIVAEPGLPERRKANPSFTGALE